MHSKNFLLLLTLLVSINTFAQKEMPRLIEGYIFDTFTNSHIPDVKVSVLRADSTLVAEAEIETGRLKSSARKDTRFSVFFVEQKGDSKDYILKVEHPQYKTLFLPFTTKKYGRQVQISFPDVFMQRDNGLRESLLDEVQVTATKVKLYHKGDTLVFNADAFNVPDGSMLDALVKQLPGTELKPNGEIYVEGRKIDNLLLNGKDFFRGRNKLMLENLPYYTVQQIKVYDKMTDKAVALNDEAAPKDYVMDVNLKKEYSTGYMANVEAGGGDHGTYLARLFGLRFSNHARMTLLGGSNNTNVSSDVNYQGEFDNRLADHQGVTTKHYAEFDWLLEQKKWKNDLQASYNNSKKESGQLSNSEMFHGQTGSTYALGSSSNLLKDQQIAFRNDYSLNAPFWLESNTAFTYRGSKATEEEQKGNAFSDVWRTRQTALLDSLLQIGMPVNAYGVQNVTSRLYSKSPDYLNAGQVLNYAGNLPNGDILDVKASVNYSSTEYDATRGERYIFYAPSEGLINKNEAITGGIKDLTYNTHLIYKMKNLWLADWTVFADYQFGLRKDHENIMNTDLMMLDEQNSHNYRTRDNFWSLGLTYDRTKWMKDSDTDYFEFSLNLPVNAKNRNTDYHRSLLDTTALQHYIFFEPAVKLEMRKGKNVVELTSDYSHSMPSVTQLITLPLTSDRINTYMGNANLKPSSTLNISLQDKKSLRNSYFLMRNRLAFSKSFNQIVNSYSYNPANGTNTFMPENVNGTWNITYENYYWNALDKDRRWILKWDFTTRYAENPNYLVSSSSLGQERSNNRMLSLDLPLSISYTYKDFECVFGGRVNWKHAFNNTSQVAYSNAQEYAAELGIKKRLFWNIYLDNTLTVLKRNGYFSDDLNKAQVEWDINLTKSILKDRLTLRFTALDLLRQRSNLTYVVNDQGVSEIQQTKLPGYVLLTASYKMHKNPKKK